MTSVLGRDVADGSSGAMPSGPAAIRRGYEDISLGQVHYREAGAGSPVVMFHRTPSNSAMFERVMPLLGEHHRVLALDTPGFGMSDSLPEPPGETMKPYVDAAVEFLDAKGIGPATLVGHSTGGSIAMNLAADHPERVNGLVIASFTGPSTQEEVDELFAVLHDGISSNWGDPIDLDGSGDFLEAYPVSQLRALLAEFEDPEHFIQEMIAHLQGLPNYHWPFEAVLALPGPIARFPEINCPVLFINAQSGIGYPFAKRAQERFPGSGYVEIAGTSEYPMQNPQAFADAVHTFMEEAV